MMREALVLLAIAATTVSAQPAPDRAADRAADSKVDAQSLMQSGVKLLDANDYLGALAVFKTAYERFQGAKILLNIGTTLKLLKRDPDAANAYQRYLDAKDSDPKRRAEIQKLVDKIDTTAGRYDITPTPSDATITIDDDGDWLHAVYGGKWRVAPGRHSIAVKAQGYEPKTKSVTVGAGEQIALEIQLVPIPKPIAQLITVPAERGLVAVPRNEGPRSRFGALVVGHFDRPHGGAALVGLTADVRPQVEARAAAILGPKLGAYAGLTYAFLTQAYRPYVAVGVPLFFSSGVRYGLRGAGGLEWVVSRHLALILEAGVEHEFNPEMGATRATVFVPAVGVVGRL
jgi:hypothetical protein